MKIHMRTADYLNAQGPIFHYWRHGNKDKVQVSLRNEILSTYCIIFGLTSQKRLKQFKTIFYYILNLFKLKLIWINSPQQKYENKRNKKLNVLVFENYPSLYTKECC